MVKPFSSLSLNVSESLLELSTDSSFSMHSTSTGFCSLLPFKLNDSSFVIDVRVLMVSRSQELADRIFYCGAFCYVLRLYFIPPFSFVAYSISLLGEKL